jgi:DNA polymerase III delta prime subunit
MNIQHAILLTERAIAGAFINNGLYVHLCGTVQGPHTLTFGLRLYEPTQRNLNKALGLSGAVEAAISDSPVRIYMDRGVILIETPSPMPAGVDGRRLRGQGLAVPLGMTSRQTVSGIDLLANPHLLLVGPTNRGKTTAARLVAYHLAKQNPMRQARFIVSTFKPKDWQAFASLAHTTAVITDPQESAQMIDYLVGVMHRRTQKGQDSPHLFVFLDDLLNLLGVATVDDQLAQLASLGRGAGIHLIVGTQRLGEKGAAGSLVTGNIPTRLVFGTADAQDAALFTGRGGSGAEKLGRYPGDALLVTDGGTQRIAVGHIKDTHLHALPQQPDSQRPWLHRTGTPDSDRSPRNGTVPPATTGTAPVPAQEGRGAHAPNDPSDTPLTRTGTQTRPLPDREPDEEARRYLRRLYEETGSKNKVLLLAWGGVVNESGKTPKTKRWLDEALTEVMT